MASTDWSPSSKATGRHVFEASPHHYFSLVLWFAASTESVECITDSSGAILMTAAESPMTPLLCSVLLFLVGADWFRVTGEELASSAPSSWSLLLMPNFVNSWASLPSSPLLREWNRVLVSDFSILDSIPFFRDHWSMFWSQIATLVFRKSSTRERCKVTFRCSLVCCLFPDSRSGSWMTTHRFNFAFLVVEICDGSCGDGGLHYLRLTQRQKSCWHYGHIAQISPD